MVKRGVAVVVLLMAAVGCASDRNPSIDPAVTAESSQSPDGDDGVKHAEHKKEKATERRIKPAAKPAAVDPREGGFEIALGEWAVTPEAPALRPGEVTFVISNRGTMPHGFEIELEGDSSGSGSGDLFKAESSLIQPGQSTRMTVTLSRTGIYKIECLVDGHDDMGMEGPLEIRANAPLQQSEPKRPRSAAGNEVSISDFAFQPPTITVDAGTEVTWTNDDPAQHTVTSIDGTFDSDILEGGQRFKLNFDRPGTYDYRCNVHPDMTGTVKVR